MSAGAKQDGSRKPGTFVKGDPRINRAGGPRGKKQPNSLLQDMRAVYEQNESQDRGPAQKALRRMFNEDIDKFIARLGRLEQAYQAPVSKEAEPPEEVDGGAEKARALGMSLLEQVHTQLAEKDAEFAKRPDAAALGATLQEKLAASLERERILRETIDELRGQRHGWPLHARPA